MASDIPRHPDDEIIESYSLGLLAEDRLGRTEEHLLVCEHCRQRVERADSWVTAVRVAARQVSLQPIEKERFSLFPKWLPAFAALAAIVIAGFFALRTGSVAPAAVALSATRGPGDEILAPAQTPLQLKPDTSTLPQERRYVLEIIDSTGKPMWRGAYPGDPAKGLAPGLYFVRVSSQTGKLYREYGLQVGNAR